MNVPFNEAKPSCMEKSVVITHYVLQNIQVDLCRE